MIAQSTCRRIAKIGLVIAGLSGWACARLESNDVAVVIEGENTLAVGETLTLSATTERGTDHGYAWTSDDEDVASVDEHGTVTGVAPGTVNIIAAGMDTHRSDEHTIVVVENVGATPATRTPRPRLSRTGTRTARSRRAARAVTADRAFSTMSVATGARWAS
jgi:hypothetical protein